MEESRLASWSEDRTGCLGIQAPLGCPYWKTPGDRNVSYSQPASLLCHTPSLRSIPLMITEQHSKCRHAHIKNNYIMDHR